MKIVPPDKLKERQKSNGHWVRHPEFGRGEDLGPGPWKGSRVVRFKRDGITRRVREKELES
jgi:hypothetical protein